ncbi:MAG TPA: phospholipase D-like domain-containing protein [Allosphingosinicella sp.]
MRRSNVGVLVSRKKAYSELWQEEAAMRRLFTGDRLKVRAICGTGVILFAVDVAANAREGLLGLAIGQLDENDEPRWLRGSKVFRSVVPEPDPGATYSSAEHPIQSLIWGDYSAQPGQTYRYRVAPVYGTPASPELGEPLDFEVRTEDPSEGVHGIYFNRGTIASQAYAREFGNRKPEHPDDPDDPRVRWLARGSLDAALDFIAQAGEGDRLHVAAYEFTYEPILLALKHAAERGCEVAIVHEAGQGRDDETGEIGDTSATVSARAAIADLGLASQPRLTLIGRTRRRKIPHNKFIVLVRGGEAEQLLTGSTNFTASGFTGQLNLIHIVRDSTVAAAYLEYWTQLADDPPTSVLARWCEGFTSEDSLNERLSEPAIVPLFSPRKRDSMLVWYADRMGAAEQTVMLTAAFGVNPLLAAQFGIDKPFVRFALLEDKPNAALRAKLAQDRDVIAAYGSLLGAYLRGERRFPESSLDEWFLREELFRRTGHVFFIHTKFLLIDPLTETPLICSGSANFSTASLEDNDENMLLIQGDIRVADIFLTEFDRVLRHFYARQSINRIIEQGGDAAEAKFLVEDDSWLEGYVRTGAVKTNRQRLFFPDWPG